MRVHETSPLLGSARIEKGSSLDDDVSGASSSTASSSNGGAHGSKSGGSGGSFTRLELLRYYVPVLGWLPTYDFSRVWVDMLAGLAVSVLIVPQALAYSTMAGLPPIAGLATSCFPALIYFIMGHSRHMSVGPESTSAILMGNIITRTLGDLGPEVVPGSTEYAQLALDQAFRVTLLSGFLCLGMGLARIGFVDSILSQPVLEGFVVSIALLLITDQFPKLLGLPMQDLSPEAQGLEKWRYTFEHLPHIDWTTAGVSACILLALIGLRAAKGRFPKHHWMSNFPELFLVVCVATGASYLLDLQARGVAVLGHIQSGFVAPRLPTMDANDVSSLLSASLSIAIIGFVDSNLASRIYAQKHGYAVSSNRELVALGTANIFGSVFGCFPAYGSLTRTKVADTAGAMSQICNLTCSAVVGLVSVALLPFLAPMPRVVISAMIFLVACSLLDLSSLRFLLQIGDTKDAGLYLAMACVTFFFGVDTGLMFAFTACLLLLVKQTNRPCLALLGRTAAGEYVELGDVVSAPRKLDDIFLVKLSGSMHFANVASFKNALERLERFGDVRAHPASRATPYWNDNAAAAASADSSESTDSNGVEARSPIASAIGSSTVPPSVLVSRAPYRRQSVILDLSECPSADSTAIHMLVGLFAHYDARRLLVVLVVRSTALHHRLVCAGAEAHVSAVFRGVTQAVTYAETERDRPNTTASSASAAAARTYESFRANVREQSE